MRRNLVLVAILIGLISIVLIRNNQIERNKVLGTQSEGQITPTAAATESPAPTANIIQGKIISITKVTNSSNNSYLAVIDTGSLNENIYLTPYISINNNDNQQLTREDLRVGDNIYVAGRSVEGGIEASQIIILSSISPTISIKVSPTSSF
jgi:hypothetical protein